MILCVFEASLDASEYFVGLVDGFENLSLGSTSTPRSLSVSVISRT